MHNIKIYMAGYLFQLSILPYNVYISSKKVKDYAKDNREYPKSAATWCCLSLKPIFHWKLGLRWLPNANEINAKFLGWGPNTTDIPLIRVGGLCSGKPDILVSLTQIFSLGESPNAKIRVGPNASSFASLWNIGF